MRPRAAHRLAKQLLCGCPAIFCRWRSAAPMPFWLFSVLCGNYSLWPGDLCGRAASLGLTKEKLTP
jgi:hypothetical protein